MTVEQLKKGQVFSKIERNIIEFIWNSNNVKKLQTALGSFVIRTICIYLLNEKHAIESPRRQFVPVSHITVVKRGSEFWQWLKLQKNTHKPNFQHGFAVWAILAVRGKGSGLFNIFMGKTIEVFVYCSVYSKKLTNVKMKKDKSSWS